MQVVDRGEDGGVVAHADEERLEAIVLEHVAVALWSSSDQIADFAVRDATGDERGGLHPIELDRQGRPQADRGLFHVGEIERVRQFAPIPGEDGLFVRGGEFADDVDNLVL